METLQKIKDFCQDEINEFSVLGYEPSKYQLGYNSAINDIKEIYEEIPDNATAIEKLEAEKAELLEALEKISKVTDEGYMTADTDFQVWESELKQVHNEVKSIIQKHKNEQNNYS